jgi:hypothetical protein
MLNVIFSASQEPALEIAWRNPNPVPRHRRRHSFAGTAECAVYIQQEFVMDGEVGDWTTISNLEVVAGGQAA